MEAMEGNSRGGGGGGGEGGRRRRPCNGTVMQHADQVCRVMSIRHIPGVLHKALMVR